MPKHHAFARSDVFPSWFANAIQEFLSGVLGSVRLSAGSSTQVLVAASAESPAALTIDGRWRYRTTNATRTVSGGSGTYTVWAVASENVITDTPQPFTDATDYAFDLRVTNGADPTGVDLFRKIGEVDWSGTAITEVRQTYGAVDSELIEDAAILARHLAAGAVGSAALAPGAVTNPAIATGAVGVNKLGTSAVQTANIASSAVTAAKIATGAVSDEKLADSAVTNPKLANDAVSTAKIQSGAVTGAKVAPAVLAPGRLLLEDIAYVPPQSAFGPGVHLLARYGKEGPEWRRSIVAHDSIANLIHLDDADLAISGRTPRLRIRATAHSGTTDPQTALEVALVNVVGVSGSVTGLMYETAASLVDGSIVSFGPVGPEALMHAESDFAVPADGLYALAVRLSNLTNNGSRIGIRAALELYHV